MEFGLLVVGGFAILVAMLIAVGRFYPGTGAEQLDWKPARSHEDEVSLELEDIEQMLELQNERRRRSGRPELTEDGVRLEVEGQERERRARSELYRAEGSRPGSEPNRAEGWRPGSERHLAEGSRASRPAERRG